MDFSGGRLSAAAALVALVDAPQHQFAAEYGAFGVDLDVGEFFEGFVDVDCGAVGVRLPVFIGFEGFRCARRTDGMVLTLGPPQPKAIFLSIFTDITLPWSAMTVCALGLIARFCGISFLIPLGGAGSYFYCNILPKLRQRHEGFSPDAGHRFDYRPPRPEFGLRAQEGMSLC
jgi:hypothetical protein